jgi:hypothetical protein
MLQYLHTENRDERDLLLAIKKEAIEVTEKLQTNLAIKIVEKYAEAQERAKNKK